MPKRNSYKDVFTGKEDLSIRNVIEWNDSDDEEECSKREKLKRLLLKVINNELTPRQKEIIMLYYYKDLDTNEIGRRLGITHQSVSASMSRARLRIFRILQYYL